MRTDPAALLNERELLVLRMLAEGHTAKSVAQETGLSLNAVNDRLRAARRRTGVASSRELARLVAPRPNGSRSPEAASSPASGRDDSPARASHRSRRRLGPPLVALRALLMVALAVVLVRSVPSARPPGLGPTEDGRSIEAAVETFDPDAMRRALVSEPRERAWAEPMENALSEWYRGSLRSAGLRSMASNVSVRCGTTICEATATERAEFDEGDELTLRKALAHEAFAGLDDAPAVDRGLSVSRWAGGDARMSFSAFWLRPRAS